ncbi:16S rRNA (guanine(966)-N(2))-methyltransferase RsmD [Thermophilibacter immobilis]|uniref:16S rRNA (Guanine(966)-N(2))-methyltransferase RsmD n=1 Tax=Thermophilibacter immobilis TaxID=2779519 RepID=A0A7S7M9X6_9ACTN|nr:16S rRNA (guanine(966)-N(2))-methyltransferase RsmD [Thermophilibacter immobilis]QOY61409.1 16S rRNA (guanine(966)-N(2))-methyltransferase RsmD [Thermophilibacter immobilis]
MRIVGGKWRGRSVAAPEGRQTTRPTTDRARESIASMILSAAGLDLSGASVLDAFAGSGAMGLELVSRGAARATFVDRDRTAARRVRASAQALGARPEEFFSLAGDVFALAARGLAGAPFDVVFLDPPYAVGATRASELVRALARTGQLADGALVVYEHSAGQDGLAGPGLSGLRSKTHGITTVDLLVSHADGWKQ